MVSKETIMLRRRASEVDKGKLTAVANLEKLTFRTSALRRGAHARNVSFSKFATAVNYSYQPLLIALTHTSVFQSSMQ